MWELISDQYYIKNKNIKSKVSKEVNTVLPDTKKVEEHPQQKE